VSESRLKENATAVKKLFGTAAKLAQKQAALATLNNVTLSKIYHAIGKQIVGLEKLPPDLTPHRDKIRGLEARIATKPEQPAAAPAEGLAAKAKHLAQQAAQKASKASGDAAAMVQLQAAYVSLGRAAVDKCGEKAVPENLAAGLAEALQARKSMQQEIDILKGASKIGFLTPTRAIVGTLTLAVVVMAYVFLIRGDGRTEHIQKEFAKTPSRTARQSSNAVADSRSATSKQLSSQSGLDASRSGSPQLAVKVLLGETSQHFDQTSFKGMTLGESFDQVNARTPLNHTSPGEPFRYITPNRESFCFSEDNRLVCFSRSYEGGEEDYLA